MLAMCDFVLAGEEQRACWRQAHVRTARRTSFPLRECHATGQ